MVDVRGAMRIDPHAASRSAMALQAQRLRVSAHNTANLGSDGFEAREVVAREAVGGGVSGRDRPTGAPTPLATRDGVMVRLSNTDPVTEAVQRVSALRSYQANAAVARVAAELDRDVLDVMA